MNGEQPFLPPVVNNAQGRPLDVIELRGLTVDCIVGVFNRERFTAQPLRLDVALYLDTRTAATGGKLAHTVNYGRLAGELRFLLEACRFELLESAVEAVSRYVLAPPTGDAPHARVHAATVRVTKPQALGGLVVPSLQVTRTADEMEYPGEARAFGRADIIHEGAGYGVYRLRVKPGGVLTSHVHPRVEVSELVLGPGLLLQGRPVERGMAFHWPRDSVYRHDNPTAVEQTVLCVGRPGFVPGDAVEEAPLPETLAPATGVSYYPHESPVAPGSPADRSP
jgi:FolB domain-containing protein